MPAPDQRVPELIGGVDIRALPLTAIDGFVLSRIDGRSSCAEIIAMTGLGAEQVLAILDKLVEVGAIRLAAAPSSSLPPGTGAGQTRPPRASVAPGQGSVLPPRRRPSYGSTPRRLFSESSISGPPPPDPRSLSQRPRANTPARSRTPVPDPYGLPRRTTPAPGPTRTRTSPPSMPASSPPAPRPQTPSAPFPTLPPSSDAPGRHSSLTPRASIPVSLPPLKLPPVFSSAPTGSFQIGVDSEPARPPSPDGSSQSPVPQVISSMSPAADSGDKRALYDPSELDEEVELPRERRLQVLELYHRLSQLDYYGMLGIAYGADKKEIRSAYFALSKQFHPDSMFRKELGTYKAKMTKVFQALTEAYETLGKKKSREEYDGYLRSTRSARDAERALATDDVARADINVEVPRPPPLPVTDYALPTPTPVPQAPREVSADARRIARELMERRLRALPQRPHSEDARAKQVTSSMPSGRPSMPAPSSPGSGAPIGRQELARQLGRTLIDVSKITGSADKVARAVSGAKAAFERGDIAASVQHMARAFSLAPDRTDLHQEYDRLQHMLAQKLAHDYEQQAKFEVKQAKWAAAAVSWAKVCDGRPEDPFAHRSAALALLKAGGDLRGAQKFAQRAVYLAPNDVDARILLAQTYLTVGLKLNARRELDAAAKLDPGNEMVKNLLSDLKG